VRRAVAAVLLVVTAAVAAGCGDDEAKPFSGTVLDRPYQVPDVDLTDTDGEPFSLAADTDERLTLVFFGYVNCPDICPAVLNNLASALTRLDDADRDDVQVVFVTSDPRRDTPEAIRSYLDRYDESFIGLTSDLDTIVTVGQDLAVGIDERDPGGHTTTIVGIDSGDEAPVFWRQDTSPSQYANDIHTLLG
jgi:protein SCO1/2